MTTPGWALTLAYWLHMLATVVWIGGLGGLVLFILPAARKQLNPAEFTTTLERYQSRLDNLAWMSIAILLSTGLFQMSASPHYEGWLSIHNLWTAAILVKHIFFFGMVGLSAYLTWGVLPALRRNSLLISRGRDAPQVGTLQQRHLFLVRLNLILGVVVLGLTAIARAA
jgi:uncharacterized membrane protein